MAAVVARLVGPLPAPARAAISWAGWVGLAFVLFAVVLVVAGKDPLLAYASILGNTLGTAYGLSETLVKMTPLLLTALAVAVPARVGLVNVGGEGQLFVGGLAASFVALTVPDLPALLLVPSMAVAGFAGGAVWGAVCGYLRARGWLNEVFSTLLLNYLAVLVVQMIVYGPWRDAESANYPQSPQFATSAWLPTLGNTRVHLGLAIGIVAAVAFFLVLQRTRWGLEMRAIGGNSEAARRCGIPIATYTVLLLAVGGGLAGVAGMAEASGLHHRLSPGLSSGYGFVGFLASWLAGHRPLLIVPMAFLLAVLAAGGDILQITQSIPYAVVNVLMALILFVVLAARAAGRTAR